MSEATRPTWLSRVAGELGVRDSPLTLRLVGLVTLVFVVQVAAWFLTPADSVRQLMAAVFAEGPLTAWVFSPLFHRDPVHFLANVGAILLFGRAIETYFTPRRYALFVLGAAAASTLGAVAVLAAFAPPPHAAYGASGIAFALTGYGIRFLRADERSAVEELLAPFAVVALLFVCYDVASGPYFEPGWFNGAHAVGWIAGGATGLSR